MVLEYINKYKLEAINCLKDLSNKNTFYKQIPNLLTFSRAALSPISSILFLTGHPIISVIFTGLLLSTDLFDGKFARIWNVQSKFGADLDAMCDKIMFFWLVLPILINNPIVIINFIFEGIISYINVLGRMKKLNTKTIFSGKVKTCFLSIMLISGYLVQFFNLPVAIFNSLIAATLISQNIAVYNYIKEFKKLDNDYKNSSNVVNKQEEKLEFNYANDKEKSLSDSLKREKDFILGFNEPDKNDDLKKIKIRNINNEKK